MFLWDVATGVTTRRLSGHMGKIYVVEFNEDASVCASGRPFPSRDRLLLHRNSRIVRLVSKTLGSPVWLIFLSFPHIKSHNFQLVLKLVKRSKYSTKLVMPSKHSMSVQQR